jgi:hypothetical protein
MTDRDPQGLERQLREAFEAQLPYQIARAVRIKDLGMMPAYHFSRASFECRDMFIAGLYIGCISLCQSVAEALARLLCSVNEISGNSVLDKAAKLQKRGVISPQIREAFRTIYAHDRNIFHHLDPAIETDNASLGARAEECVNALHRIESGIFAYALCNNAIVPEHSQYWWPAFRGTTFSRDQG